MPAHLVQADVVVVHGGNDARTRYGIELYQQGYAPDIWHTGYASGRTEIAEEIQRAGVPAQAFRYLTTTSTWSDGSAIVAALRESRTGQALIVTDWWHSRRALCATTQQIGDLPVQIFFQPAPAPYGPDDWWLDGEMRGHVLRELAKLGYYGVRYGMNPWGC